MNIHEILENKIRCCNCDNLLIKSNDECISSIFCSHCYDELDSPINFYTQIKANGNYFLNKNCLNICFNKNLKQISFGSSRMVGLSVIRNYKLDIFFDKDKILFDMMFEKLCKLSLLQ